MPLTVQRPFCFFFFWDCIQASVEHPHKLIEVEAAVDRRGKTAAELAKTAKKGRSPDLIAELVKLCSLTDS